MAYSTTLTFSSAQGLNDFITLFLPKYKDVISFVVKGDVSSTYVSSSTTGNTLSVLANTSGASMYTYPVTAILTQGVTTTSTGGITITFMSNAGQTLSIVALT